VHPHAAPHFLIRQFFDHKDIRDKAEALRAYAKKANNREAEVQFADIKLQAERKCGELL